MPPSSSILVHLSPSLISARFLRPYSSFFSVLNFCPLSLS
jgi:hypothetical protein